MKSVQKDFVETVYFTYALLLMILSYFPNKGQYVATGQLYLRRLISLWVIPAKTVSRSVDSRHMLSTSEDFTLGSSLLHLGWKRMYVLGSLGLTIDQPRKNHDWTKFDYLHVDPKTFQV